MFALHGTPTVAPATCARCRQPSRQTTRVYPCASRRPATRHLAALHWSNPLRSADTLKGLQRPRRQRGGHARTTTAGLMDGLFGKKELPAVTEGRLISSATRTTIATLLNTVIDVPIIGEVEEQILLLTIVEQIANKVEEKCEDMLGLGELEHMSKRALDKWRDGKVEELNEAIDLPVLNEAMEAHAIRFVLDKVIAHQVPGYEYAS